jgi:ComEC/Rec2-related protein
MREAIDKRIRANVPGDRGAIASALITGKRDAITTPVNDAMYIPALVHVLSISGYHMVVVTGVVFFVLRALFALMAAVANRYAIKKWAALAALAAATFYLLLSGAEVATQRSFIMIAIVLIGVMLDRPTLTLRTLTVAALGVLVLAPESVVHPSFQMSFAATLAIVAGYQSSLAFARGDADTPLGARIALWGGREVIGMVLISLLAGFATTLFTAYHFHRLTPYGVIANVLAMPIVSVWVMPMGIAGVLAMPFGFDGVCWRLMGEGIDWMIAVALWVTSLPGSVGRITAFGTGPLLLGSAGLLLLGLLKSPLRFSGALLLALASVWALRTPQPDVLVSPDGASFAVRGATGRFAILKTGSDTFAIQQWLAADADARAVRDPTLAAGLTCDDVGCIGRLRDGPIIAIVRGTAAFEEDCRRAALVLTAREAPRDCGTHVVDRKIWQRNGATALRRMGDTWVVTMARPDGHDRPWAPARATPGEATAPPNTPARRHAQSGRSGPGRLIGSDRRPVQAQYRRNIPTSLPWMRTRCGGRMRTSYEVLAGSSAIEAPRRRKRFSVASSSSIRATTISPVSAPSVLRSKAMSPSRMPASIIESPRTSSAKCSPVESISGGMLMTCVLLWIASIGVPAAIRPIIGTATGRPPSSSDGARTRPRFPSMTLGVKPRVRVAPMPCPTDSGSLMTSMARARLGSRRMKPRSSSAVINRCIPDFERRSRASFISSKDGGTPVSLRRSCTKRRSSNCLRVSIAWGPPASGRTRPFRNKS